MQELHGLMALFAGDNLSNIQRAEQAWRFVVGALSAHPAAVKEADPKAVKAHSYGGITGINDYLMEDGSVVAMRPSDVVWATPRTSTDESSAGSAPKGEESIDDVKRAYELLFRENARLRGLLGESHDSDCATNNRGVPELLGPCDCSLSGAAGSAKAAEPVAQIVCEYPNYRVKWLKHPKGMDGSMLYDHPAPPTAAVPGEGSTRAHKLWSMVVCAVGYQSGGNAALTDTPAMRELKAEIDELCIGLDSPPAAAVPESMVLIPKRLTRAMRDVIDTEGWAWEDLLAAAEVITEAEHAALAAVPTDSEMEREAFVLFLTTSFPRTFNREQAEHHWRHNHISAITWRAGRAALASTPATVPQAWKLVPVEPSDAMLDAAARASMQHLIDCINVPGKAHELGSEENIRKTHASRYRSMLAATPNPPTATDVTDEEIERAHIAAATAFVLEGDTATVQADRENAARDVLAERQRQISAEGWTPEHDDEHDDGTLSGAAAGYSIAAADLIHPQSQGDGGYGPLAHPPGWPNDWDFKPADARRMLVKSGALILAEIERLDRAARATKGAKA